MIRLRKSGSVSGRSSISADISFRRAFWSSFKFFWNHLCTHFSQVQILCNNLVDRTFINNKFICDYSNCQTSVLTNESPHTVDVCACSHRGGASRSWFICHRFSPIYKASVPPKYLSTLYKIILKCLLSLFLAIGSAFPQFNTQLDCITLLEIILLHFCEL
jgi:hypothetical protein